MDRAGHARVHETGRQLRWTIDAEFLRSDYADAGEATDNDFIVIWVGPS